MNFSVKCIDCHFLSGIIRSTGINYPRTLPKKLREDIHLLENKEKIKADYFGMTLVGCYFGIWDNLNISRYQEIAEVITQKRSKKECPFFPFKKSETMTLKGAEIIQKRQENWEELKFSRYLSFAGLIFAALALLLNLYTAVFDGSKGKNQKAIPTSDKVLLEVDQK